MVNHFVLRVIVLVTLVVPLDLVVRVTLVVVFPLFCYFYGLACNLCYSCKILNAQ